MDNSTLPPVNKKDSEPLSKGNEEPSKLKINSKWWEDKERIIRDQRSDTSLGIYIAYLDL